MKMYIKNPGFWILIYSVAVTVALIVVSVKLHNARAEKSAINTEYVKYKLETQREKNELNNKIQIHENRLKTIDAYVRSLSDAELDSEYERLFPSN